MNKNMTVCRLGVLLLALPLMLWACSDDELPTPNPGPITAEAEYADLGEWFSGELPTALAAAEYKASETADGLSTSFYQLQFGDVAAHLDATTLADNSEKWMYRVTPAADTTQVAFFRQAVAAYLANADYEYWNTLYTPAGSSTASRLTREQLEEKLENADFTTESFRTGFRSATDATEISITDGEAALTIRPLTFGDNWKYYTQHVLAQDYDSLYQALYFSIKSAGFIPPFIQLMIFDGKDDNGKAFNLTMQAPPSSPISTVEGAYLLDDEEVQSYWISLLEAADAEEKMGTFEQAFVFSQSNEPIATLNTLAETIEWARNNDLADVGYVMPIFRVSDKLVIVPQASSTSGLVITMSELETEESSAAQIRKLATAARHD